MAVRSNVVDVGYLLTLPESNRMGEHWGRNVNADNDCGRQPLCNRPRIDSRSACNINNERVCFQVETINHQMVFIFERDTLKEIDEPAPPQEPSLVNVDDEFGFHQPLGN